jgi:tetratricopeptide (TPR) repeat protein
VRREIGRGGFGVVLEAEDEVLHRRVALKFVRWRASAPVAAALEEAEASATLRHPNVVTLHDAGSWRGGKFLVYELLRGRTLAERLDEGPIPAPEARRILREVAQGLAHVHRSGFVHRDLKPANVFLEDDGGVKLLDLGLAQAIGAAGEPAGTPSYAAPEQARGDAVDGRADVHAWGVLVFRLLEGRLPGEAPGASAQVRGGLAALGAEARAVDPSLRPRDGAALVAALGRIERRARRGRAGVAAAAAIALAAASGGGAHLLRPPAVPPGPLRLAIADAENASARPELDGLGDVLARALAPSERLLVEDPRRLAGALRASGRAAPRRLDRGAATAAARLTGASAVLVPFVAHRAEGIVVGVEAHEPESGATLFGVEERSSSEEDVFAAVDRLVQRVRAELLEHEADARDPRHEVARMLTANAAAHRRYWDGRRCIDRPSEGESWSVADCERPLLDAIAIDPDFALAHFERARLAYWQAHPTEELRALLRPALRLAARLPPPELAQLRAWEAELDGQVERAARLLREALADHPEDAPLALALGQLHQREGRYAEAVAPLEQAAALDPSLELATDTLATVLGHLGRTEALRRFADGMAASAPSPGTLHAEVLARGWLGDAEGALAVARRAAVGGRGAAREDLADALFAARQWDEAERVLREDAARGSARAGGRVGLLLRQRGRVRESAAWLAPEAPSAPATEPRLAFVVTARRVFFEHAAARDAAAIRGAIEETRAWSAENAATFAPVLAYAGAVDEAEALAPDLVAACPRGGELLSAIVTWRRGDPAAALPILRRFARAEPAVDCGLPLDAAAWLAAECALEADPGPAALEDLRRYRRTFYPLGLWRSWAHPRGLLLEAELQERLGLAAEARATLAELEALWAGADPELPMVAELHALRRRLDGAR